MKLTLAQYAESLLSLDLSDEAFEKLVSDMRSLHAALSASSEVRAPLLHPKMESAKAERAPHGINLQGTGTLLCEAERLRRCKQVRGYCQ